MKRIGLVLFLISLIILFLSGCEASCEKGQIDINSASLGELDEIIWVGPATAEKIINKRPFKDIDSLIDVSGIGEIKLDDIKEQGLACVGKETSEENKDEEKDEETNKKTEEQETEIGQVPEAEKEKEEEPKNKEKTLELNPISLNNKNLTNKDKTNSNLAIYGILFFCILLVFLYMRKKNSKNEFR